MRGEGHLLGMDYVIGDYVIGTVPRKSWLFSPSYGNKCYLHLCVLFWPHHVACMISVPWPGIKPVPARVGTYNLSYWTGKEVPASVFNEKLVLFLGIEGRAVYVRGKFNYWVRLVGGEASSLNFQFVSKEGVLWLLDRLKKKRFSWALKGFNSQIAKKGVGNSLAVQLLGLSTLLPSSQVQFMVRKLRSHNPRKKIFNGVRLHKNTESEPSCLPTYVPHKHLLVARHFASCWIPSMLRRKEPEPQ